MKKKLFNENETYTRESIKIMSEVESLLNPLVKEKINENYSIRELEYILHQTVTDIMLDIILEINKTQSKFESDEELK